MTLLPFDRLPAYDLPLPQDELKLLSALPAYPTIMEIEQADQAAARRLERRGLVKVHRQKDDPVAILPTWYGGRLQQPIAEAPHDRRD